MELGSIGQNFHHLSLLQLSFMRFTPLRAEVEERYHPLTLNTIKNVARYISLLPWLIKCKNLEDIVPVWKFMGLSL